MIALRSMCCILCGNRYEGGEEVKSHKIPADEKLQKIEVIPGYPIKWVSGVACIEHFAS